MGRGEKEDTAGHDPADEYLPAEPLLGGIEDSDRRDRWLKILLGDRTPACTTRLIWRAKAASPHRLPLLSVEGHAASGARLGRVPRQLVDHCPGDPPLAARWPIRGQDPRQTPHRFIATRRG